MTTYNTGNPLGSTDVKDLYDNAENFDVAINSQQPNWIDRFGRQRKTFGGMESDFQNLLLNSGYESDHLTYVDGTPLIVNRQTQLIDRAGVVYRVKLPASFPVTLSGNWAADAPLLLDTGDQALRQQLASTAGTSMIGAPDGRTLDEVLDDLENGGNYISLKTFGAVGDALFWNGTAWFSDAGFTTPATDDTAAIQAAVTYCSNNFKTLFIPSATPFLITSKITASRAFSMKGEMPSPTTLDGVFLNKGSTFISTVVGDWTFDIGGNYERGLNFQDFRIYTKEDSGKGVILHNMGWDGYVRNWIIEGFKGGGLWCDYVQDILFENMAIIGCGTDGVVASLTTRTNCNLLTFNRLHIEITTFMMDLGGYSQAFSFTGCHFEVSEYNNPPDAGSPYFKPHPDIGHINSYGIFSTIQIYGGSQSIDFSACTFGPNTVQGVVKEKMGAYTPGSFTGGAEASVPHMISVNAANVFFRGCFFLQTSGYYSAKFLTFNDSDSGVVDGCFFQGLWTNGYSIILSGTRFVNNNLNFIDLANNYVAPYNQKFYGILAQTQPSIVENNVLSCANGAQPAKNEGAIFAYIYPGSGQRSVLGQNMTGAIPNTYTDHSTAWSAKCGFTGGRVDLQAASGSLDLARYPINSNFYWAGVYPLTAITNAAFNQEVELTNEGGTAVTVTGTSYLHLKGGVPASVPLWGKLTLKENGNSQLLEKCRSF